jgi:ATP-dependent protease HslVU (ClpYQ) peptidase subunit
MSIIAAQTTPKKIKFAFDSQMNYADYRYSIEKAFKVRNVIFGKSGDIRTDPYFKHFIEERTKNEDLILKDEDSVVELINNYLEFYKDTPKAQFIKLDSMLISDARKTFYIDLINKNCFEIKDFEAIGSGREYAIGAYKAGATIEETVNIATRSNIYCGGDIIVIEVDKK